MWGANDKLSPPANAGRFNAAISGSRKGLIDKAGHHPFVEHADGFDASGRCGVWRPGVVALMLAHATTDPYGIVLVPRFARDAAG